MISKCVYTGKEANGCLWHGEECLFSGDAVPSVHAEADAAAHRDAADERHIGLVALGDAFVEHVLFFEEFHTWLAGHDQLANGLDVAAGAKGRLARSLDHNGAHALVALELVQLLEHHARHVVVESVELLGTIEHDDAHLVHATELDIVRDIGAEHSAQKDAACRSIGRCQSTALG